MLPLAVSFGKALGPDYFGVLPRTQRAGGAGSGAAPGDAAASSASAASLGLVGVQVIPQEQQAGFLRLFRTFFTTASTRLLEEHKVGVCRQRARVCVRTHVRG